MTTRRHLLGAAALCAASFAGLPALAQETIKIGNLVTQSGFLKSVGETAVTAFDIAVGEINAAGGVNGKQIELVQFDTGSDPKQAATGARKLIQDDAVVAILGPFSSGETRVAMTMAERAGTLMIPTAASAPGLTEGAEYTWRLTEDEEKQFGRLLTALTASDIPHATAEIVYVSDEVVANSAGTQLYPAMLAKAGIETGEPIPVQRKSFDMSAQVAGIMQKAPDIVAVAALPDSASKLIKELRRQGFEGRIIGSQIFADPQVTELFGEEGDGTMVVAGFWHGRTEQSEAFNTKFLAEVEARGIHKLGAHHTDAQAYDGVYLLKQLMEAAGTTGDPAQLDEERAALAAQMEGVSFSGIVGDDVCFQGHDAELPGYVIEIKGGEWTKFAEAAADGCE
ncbi:ABC transporter substrate-binding protein [Alloyangia pacifica]|uniref:Amino acid/amide ABC transporter substrate-binding protein, HAAT family n=1 Tax=Alloyangia pacifica TaxID=311180 RepID=A0A1I6QWJ2_9RHOB|nr:ABC transporter substrate-binding protein [Alloyangia pacifica]SDG02042.1 amino acid/amide ABC transporter substrate-binding protein, HAAT family [Alloyangia pacifica]SFS56730.1 amino acid/amide ABC transporter substrate-binding protein, HAAT family [Alloyangia pacifica]